MAVSAEFKAHVTDLLAPLGDVKTKRFFSGAGFYFKDKLIAFSIRDRLYLRVDERTRGDFEREGAKPFTFKKQTGEVVSMAYYEIPARVFEDADEMVVWARRAYDAALAKTAKKPSPRSKPVLADLPLVAPKQKKKENTGRKR